MVVVQFKVEWLPAQMTYMTSYLLPVKNSWFIFVLTLLAAYCTYILFFLGQVANEPATALSFFLIAWLAALAVLEHVFLMIPMGETVLWRWARTGTREAS